MNSIKQIPSLTRINSYSSLCAKNLRKVYEKRVIVENISISVNTGEIIGLLGPNGAGKTTSFYMIMGLISVDSGNIEIDGKIITKTPIYKRAEIGLSYLPQDVSIFRRLTVKQNIQAILELQFDNYGKRFTQSEIDKQVDILLSDLQIQHICKSMGSSLSGGERRRVEIARTLATNPRFILLDEPFYGVDPISIIDIQRIISFLKNRGIGILITDHNVRETLKICDRAYIINEGKVLINGTPNEIVHNKLVQNIYLGNNFYM
ncbi:MAG: LPS export ABC transporter ATP-binding protein [Bordetella sp.]|nr:MAG: LPS export ABC transporter ATP-binding protein [Bordetella sp.]